MKRVADMEHADDMETAKRNSLMSRNKLGKQPVPTPRAPGRGRAPAAIYEESDDEDERPRPPMTYIAPRNGRIGGGKKTKRKKKKNKKYTKKIKNKNKNIKN